MSGLLITVEVRSVYGRDTIYPVDDAAAAFAAIAGTTTLTVPVLKQIIALGYEVRYARPTISGIPACVLDAIGEAS